jgi:hypothetical protein
MALEAAAEAAEAAEAGDGDEPTPTAEAEVRQWRQELARAEEQGRGDTESTHAEVVQRIREELAKAQERARVDAEVAQAKGKSKLAGRLAAKKAQKDQARVEQGGGAGPLRGQTCVLRAADMLTVLRDEGGVGGVGGGGVGHPLAMSGHLRLSDPLALGPLNARNGKLPPL